MIDRSWFRPLVWMDYRLALLFTVILPLILLIWSLVKKKEAMQILLVIYWRVASLLMITVYLLIPGWNVGYFTGVAARILIPLTLWFWVDLNEEIKDLPNSLLKFVFRSWRWATTIYCILGIGINSLFIPCGLSNSASNEDYCKILLEAPKLYQQFFHSKSSGNLGFLGFLGAFALCIYILYFVYFILIRLGKQGRSALEQ